MTLIQVNSRYRTSAVCHFPGGTDWREINARSWRAPPNRKTGMSGIGERPVIVRSAKFGLNGSTADSVCVAPTMSASMLEALQNGHIEQARAAHVAKHSRISLCLGLTDKS